MGCEQLMLPPPPPAPCSNFGQIAPTAWGGGGINVKLPRESPDSNSREAERAGTAQPRATMRGLLLLLLALVVLLAALARAEEPQEETLVARVQSLAQQVADKAQEGLATIRDSQVAQQARDWVQHSIQQAKEYVGTLKQKFSTLLE